MDDFLAPPKLGDDLLVGEGSERRGMTPGMDRDVVLAQVFCLKDSREGNCTRANNKERRLERILVEEVQQVGGVVRRAVIIRETPCIRCGASRDISVTNTPTTCPPTTTSVGGSLCVIWTPAGSSHTDIWD